MSLEKRIKERGIQDVQDILDKWRNIYQENGGKFNLDQVAAMVGVSRKTLDDYSLQLRRAKELGFDFSKFREKKMGYLRNFVKKNMRFLKNTQRVKPQKHYPQQSRIKKQAQAAPANSSLPANQPVQTTETNQLALSLQSIKEYFQMNLGQSQLLKKSRSEVSEYNQSHTMGEDYCSDNQSTKEKQTTTNEDPEEFLVSYESNQEAVSNPKQLLEVDEFFNFGKENVQDFDFIQFYY